MTPNVLAGASRSLAGFQFDAGEIIGLMVLLLVVPVLGAVYLGLFLALLVQAASTLPVGRRGLAVFPAAALVTAFVVQGQLQLAAVSAGLVSGWLIIARRSRAWAALLAAAPVLLILFETAVFS